MAVGAKFLGALEHFEGIRLKGLRFGEEPADLQCTDDTGRPVLIQVVEAIDLYQRTVQETRAEYLAALRESQPEFAGAFSGCAVAIVDSGEPPYLPRVGTTAGRYCFDKLRIGIQEIGTTIHNLPVGQFIRRDVSIDEPPHTVSLLITRHEIATSPDRLKISWAGSGPSHRTDLPRGILPAAVSRKLAKHYSGATGRFTLLVYSIDTLIVEGEPDVQEARRLLAEAKHPFDEVWYLYPYVDEALGHLVRVWPARATG